MVMGDNKQDGDEMEYRSKAAVAITNSALILLNYNRSMSFHCEVYEVLWDIFIKNNYNYPLEDWFTTDEGMKHIFQE